MKAAKIKVERKKTQFKEIGDNSGYDITSQFTMTLIEINNGENVVLEGDLNCRWEFEFPGKAQEEDKKAKLEYTKLFADAWMKHSKERLSEIAGKVEPAVHKLVASTTKQVKSSTDKKTPKEEVVEKAKEEVKLKLNSIKTKLAEKLPEVAKDVTEKAAADAGRRAKKPYGGKMIPYKYQKKIGTTVLKFGALSAGIAGLAIAAPEVAVGVAVAGGLYLALRGTSNVVSATKDFLEQTQLYLEARNISLAKNNDAIKAVQAATEAMRATVNKHSSLLIRMNQIQKRINDANDELSGQKGELDSKKKEKLQSSVKFLEKLLEKYENTFKNNNPSELLTILEKAGADLKEMNKKSQASVSTISDYADKTKEISAMVEDVLSIAV